MKCEIRKWRIEDAGELAAALSNKNVLNNLRDGIPYPYTERDAKEYIAAMLSADENNTFAYAVTADGRVVGSVGAFRQENIHSRTAELGYYIAEEYWGKGIMTEAVRLLCRIIFDSTDIIRIFAEPFSYNTGSCRVLEKAGFEYEGTLRCNAFKNGRAQDMKMYALTRNAEKYPVKRLDAEEIQSALSLIWEVFCLFEAPVYSQEGIREFRGAIDDNERNKKMKFYGAFDGDMLVGVIAVRKPRHIGYFFVKSDYQRRGIGKKLFENMCLDCETQEFTVNSSPYAVEIYRRLGFVPTDSERTENGIRYTPMRFKR